MEHHLAQSKGTKRVAIIWLVLHKVVAVNDWCGRISTKIDKSCPHCGPQSMELVELVEHMFFSCLLAQQGWRYVANIMYQHLAKRGNLGVRKSFPMIQCLFDQPLWKTRKQFSRTWFFLRSGVPWIIWRQQHDMVFNALQWPIEKIRQVTL